jgi:hypothetical protein
MVNFNSLFDLIFINGHVSDTGFCSLDFLDSAILIKIKILGTAMPLFSAGLIHVEPSVIE